MSIDLKSFLKSFKNRKLNRNAAQAEKHVYRRSIVV